MSSCRFVVFAVWSIFAACGGAPAEPEAPVAAANEAPVKTTPEPRAPAAPTSRRAEDAAKWVNDMKDVSELEQRGRLAASGLSEAQFELPESIRKALEAISSGNLDASQSTAVVVALIDEEPAASGAIDAACKPGWAELAKELRALSPERRTERVHAACKGALHTDAADREKLMFASVLLAIVVEGLLEQRGDASEAERTLARFIVHVHRSEN